MKRVACIWGGFGLLLLLRCTESSESTPEPLPHNIGGSGALSFFGGDSAQPGEAARDLRTKRARPSRPSDGGSAGGEGARDEGICEDSLPILSAAPERLSETGLYEDILTKKVSEVAHSFTPQFRLWSDGAEKSRWIYLPECAARINNADEDHWSFPVGMRVWKQFVVDGLRIETRLISRVGPGVDDFIFAHYLWNDEESEAWLIDAETPHSALSEPRGTTYTVPPPATCPHCHGETGTPEGGLPSRVLGFSAIQLSHGGPGVRLRDLVEAGRLTHPRQLSYSVPGSPLARAAVGYLHANCGFCHNPSVDGVAFPFHPMSLLLSPTDAALGRTGVYRTAVGHDVLGYQGECSQRIDPDDPGLEVDSEIPSNSCIVERMSNRGNARQMPPIDSHQVDEEGLQLIRDWIREM